MADLLGDAVRDQIRLAIKDVTDTFCVHPIAYELMGESLDIHNEDREDTTMTPYAFNALCEFSDNRTDAIDEEPEGAINDGEVKLSVNWEDVPAGLKNDGDKTVKMMAERDYFTTHGIRYKVRYVGYDGPLEFQPILVIIFGRKEEPRT